MTTGYNKFFNEARKAKDSAPPGLTATRGRGPKLPRLADRIVEKRPLPPLDFRSQPKSTANAPQRSEQRRAQDQRPSKEAKPQLRRHTQSEMAEELRNQIRSKPKKTGRPFPWPSVAAVFVLLGMGFWGMRHQERIDNWTQGIEVSFLGEAKAQTTVQDKSSAGKEATSADAAGTGGPMKDPKETAADTKGASEKKGKATYSPDEVDHFAKLNERKVELDAREEELARAEKELKLQQEDLNKRMKELEATRVSISKLLEERVQTDDKKVDSLVEMYSSMKPQQAAKVFENLDEDLAIEIIGRMKKKNAAEVMNLLKPEKAQLFSERYAGYKKKP